MSKFLRIVFAGTPYFALPCLHALKQSQHEVVAVYTQPDKSSGRGQKLHSSPVKEWAKKYSIPVITPINFKDAIVLDELRGLQPDLMIVIAYGMILPIEVLNIPSFGCINVHASILPRWRGASPIQHAILHGDTFSGITIIQMDKGMDTGGKLMEVKCQLYPEDTAKSLHDKLSERAIYPLLSTLDAIVSGEVVATPQDEILATYTKKINKQDGLIDWSKHAIEIDRKIRAFNPWPIAYTSTPNGILRIFKAIIADVTTRAKFGTILEISREGILVAAKEQCVLLQEIQFPGGNIIAVSDWINASRKGLSVDMILQ